MMVLYEVIFEIGVEEVIGVALYYHDTVVADIWSREKEVADDSDGKVEYFGK